jgi:peptidoglycan hydrolase CwlO-like protein
MDITTILEVAGTAIGSSWLTHVLTIRARVRQEQATASKAEAEANGDQIENLRKTMDAVYRPIIEDLKKQVEELNTKVNKIQAENDQLREENRALKEAVRSISPELAPSFLSIKAKNQPRSKSGQFVKKNADEADR